MINKSMQHVQQWIGCLVLASWLLLPAVVWAQAAGISDADLLPFQTIIHKRGKLRTDAGRVRMSLSKGLMLKYTYYAYADLRQWTDDGDAADFLYPMDEWASAQFHSEWIAGGVEGILKPNATSPSQPIYIGNARSGIPADIVAWYKAVRWRPPVILVGRDQIPIGAATEYHVDPLLPTNQAIFGIDQKFDTDGLAKTSNMYALDNTNLDRSLFIYEKIDHSDVWTRIGGTSKDSVIMKPPGQVLNVWHGWRWQFENARSVLMWGQSSREGGNQGKQDDYGGVIEHASRYLTIADAPRAGKLQLIYGKDGYSAALNDWDGSRFDDVGNPYIGPQFTGGDVTLETGELLGEAITGQGYIDYGRPDGDHSSDWVNLSDPADHAPTRVFVTTRARNGSSPANAYFGGTTGWWTKMKEIEIERGDYRMSHFASLGADVSGIEWTGITAGMVETMPPTSATDRANSFVHLVWMAGPIVLDPGETQERMRVSVVADLPRKENIEVGRRYLKWLAQEKGAGVHPNGAALPASVVPLTDLEKFMICEGIKDSVFAQYDRGFTAFHGGPGSGLTRAQKLAGEGLRRYPDPPPAVDLLVSDGPGKTDIYAWYPDEAMFNDTDTGVDDFNGWRVYRKQGAPWVNSIAEIASHGYRDWEMVAEIRHDGVFNAAGQLIPGIKLDGDHYNREFTFNSGDTRRVMYFADVNVVRGEPYYYAVAGFDDGSQNTLGFHPGESLEGNRRQSATAIGGVGIQVTAFSPGVTRTSNLSISGNKPVGGLGATEFALSQDAMFDVNVSRGTSRAVPVTISAASTAENTTIDHLVSDIQSALDAALGTGKVTAGFSSAGKPSATAAVTYTVTFSSVESNVVLAISGVNAATRDELGVNGAQIGRFVVVSPNPWSPDLGAGLAGDFKQLFFDNLPPLCTLKIFTETGDLVKTIEHADGSAQEVWFQVNENSQLVKSGLYILAVVNAKDVDPVTGAPTEKLDDQFVKFVIIR